MLEIALIILLFVLLLVVIGLGYRKDKKIIQLNNTISGKNVELDKYSKEKLLQQETIRNLQNSLISRQEEINNLNNLLRSYKGMLDNKFASFLSPSKKVAKLIELELGFKYSARKINELVKGFNSFNKPLTECMKDIIVKENIRNQFMEYIQNLRKL